MKHTRIIPIIMSILYAGFLSATQVIPHQVNPQIGENLWQMNYRESITLDDILDTTTLCCNCDFFITQADIDLNGGGFTITQPGNWCLAENIIITQPIFINNLFGVSFDLKGRTITSTGSGGFLTTIIDVEGSSNTIIKNGRLIARDIGTGNSFRIAVLLFNSPNTTLEDISITFLGDVDDPAGAQFNGGFAIDTSNHTTCRNCFVTGPFLDGFTVTSQNVSLFDCEVNHFSGDITAGGATLRAGVAFNIAGSNNYLENCISAGGDGLPTEASNGSTGFWIVAPNTTMYNCRAYNHKDTSLTPVPNTAPPGYGFYVEGIGCELIGCEGSYNDLTGIAATGDRVLLDSCLTTSNNIAGINLGFPDNRLYPFSVSNGAIVTNCESTYNGTLGIWVEANDVLIDGCKVANISSASGNIGIGIALSLGTGVGRSRATIHNTTCSNCARIGIYGHAEYTRVAIDGCTTDNNGKQGILFDGNPDGAFITVNACKSRFNGQYGIIVGFLNPLEAHYVLLGVYNVVNDQGFKLTNNVTYGNTQSNPITGRDLIMVLNITDPLNVQPAILNTPRLVSPPVGIATNSQGALISDGTAGSTAAPVPISPGAGVNLQYSGNS